MADKASSEVTLELGGESYVLTPSFASVCGVEERIGTNLFQLGQPRPGARGRRRPSRYRRGPHRNLEGYQ